jgi:two-component system sensor histidine kinase KdpD
MVRAGPRLNPVATSWAGYGAALGAVGLVSVLIGLVLGRMPVANVSMLYLIAVLAVAVAYGSWPAVAASVAAFLAFDFLFVEPLHTFTVADPEEWISLLLFLLTAIVTGQLAAGQRRRAQEAEHREHEAVVLYDVVRLVAEPELDRALCDVAERLRRELNLAAVTVETAAATGPATQVAVGDDDALRIIRTARAEPAQVLAKGRAPTGAARGAPGRWMRISPTRRLDTLQAGERARLRLVPLWVQERRIGALLLVSHQDAPVFDPAADRLLSAVAAQIGVAVERARLRREATESEILRRTDELKTALLNAVSHDLRTPLASIIASAGSLLQDDVAWTDTERRDFAQAIVDEAQRLNRIVGNLLDLSRLEGGSLQPEKAWYDLGALVDDVVGRLRPLTAGHHVKVIVPDELPPVLLDYVEIDQVLSNLIENAVKYAPRGSEIKVVVRPGPGEVLVSVSDRGRGIPEAALPRLFESFYRVDTGGPRPQGQGVGLAVAKGLVEAHGGRIWAANRAGGGAAFTFALPLAAEVAPAVVSGHAAAAFTPATAPAVEAG